MTGFCQFFSLSRLFETLDRRMLQDPTLRNLTVPQYEVIEIQPLRGY